MGKIAELEARGITSLFSYIEGKTDEHDRILKVIRERFDKEQAELIQEIIAEA
jgi:hypothetical protein